MSIRTFASTYPQFMNRAVEMGFGEKELLQLHRAYEAAQRLFDGLYRAQNVPFICHLVRTASILLEEKAPLATVIAGLLHSAYSVGCFKDQKHGGATKEHREELAGEIGAEALVFAYFGSRWYQKECVREHLEHVESYSDGDRQILLIRLANELEDYLDLAMMYRGSDSGRKRIEAYGKGAVELAVRLNRPILARELEEVFQAHSGKELPEAVWTYQDTSFQLPLLKWLKKSYSERLWIKSKQVLTGAGK